MVTPTHATNAALAATLVAVLTKHEDIGMSSNDPREVYLLTFSKEESPCDARHAVNALAQLHAQNQFPAFRSLLTEVYPFREDVFGYDTWCDVMPTLAVQIDSTETLAAAEAFFSAVGSWVPMDLSLEVSVPSWSQLAFVTRVAEVVAIVNAPVSGFRVTMVDLKLGRLAIGDEPTLRATSRLCDATLRGASEALRVCNASLSVASGGADPNGGLLHAAALGELFQAVCRVGVAEIPEPTAATDCDELDDEDCNTLGVTTERDADERVTAALWSAVAYSRGYSRLHIHHSNPIVDPHDDAAKILDAKYFATVLLLQMSDVKRLDWTRRHLRRPEMDAIERVRDAILSGNSLGEILWDREWSVSRHGRIFEAATLDEAIVARFGWEMHDPGHGDWIDVFVPGFAQCSVKREQWHRVNHSVELPRVDDSCLQGLTLWINSGQDAAATVTDRLLAMIQSSLVYLLLEQTSISTTGLLSTFESCPTLRRLQIGNVKVPHEPVSVDPSRIVSSELKVLHVSLQSTSSEPLHLFDAFFAAVLPRIGTKLTDVRVGTDATLPFQLSFQELALVCPRLRKLELARLQVGHFDGLINAYQLQTTQLSDLRLVDCPIDSSSLVQFADALRTPTCPEARHLTFLSIKQCGRLSGLDLASLGAFLAAFQVNRSLTTLLLRTADFEDSETVVDQLNVVRTAAYAPWTRTRSAVALMSALHARSLPWNDEAVRQILRFVPFRCRGIDIRLE